jgi:dTDP-4-amino-4,6-dideoxygalactose transaminase
MLSPLHTRKIPVVNLKAAFEEDKSEIEQALLSVASSGSYILGNEVEKFEKSLAEYLSVKHVVSVANGTDAIVISLKANNIGFGDEVITVSHTAVATVAAIEMAGAIPIFCDINYQSKCIEVEKIEKLISSKTKAIVAVHIYGQPCDVVPLLQLCAKHKILLIEDCAQAIGAKVFGKKVGQFGIASAFSFYPTKNLAALGDGGALATNSTEVYEKAIALRQYGWKTRYISELSGMNSRLDELQASILNVRLKKLDDKTAIRQKIASQYHRACLSSGLEGPLELCGFEHVYHLYVVRTKRREEFIKHLDSYRVSNAIHYPVPIHLQPAYFEKINGSKELAITELFSKEIVTVPLFPEMTQIEISLVCDALESWKED